MQKQFLRMCIACRQMKDKSQLLRVVKTPNKEFKLDINGKLDGRGAYVCKDQVCILKLKKSKLLNRAFKQDIKQEIYNEIEDSFKKL